jgi:N-acetyl sugar amidotransferase
MNEPRASAAPARVCTRCVMDTSDPQITFDAAGVCHHCTEFADVTRHRWYTGAEGQRRLDAMVGELRAAGRGRDYDCILGLSGGVDSSYLALKCHEWGLRTLAVHVDAGWNSELAVANIEKILDHTGFDLHTHVVDWEEMRDLQLAFLRSGVSNQDVPQDHAFFANLYRFANLHGIRHVLSGGNVATEGIFPKGWHGPAMDAINLRAIHARHGTQPLRHYRTVSFFELFFWFPRVRGLQVLRPLDFLDYRKADAVTELESRIGWRAYPRKHGESLFTKFFQNHYLPQRFGYDKRRPHLSSLIVSGQLGRDDALRKLAEPLYEPQELEIDIAYLCKKLRITADELQQLMDLPRRVYTDYASWDRRFAAARAVNRVLRRLRG